jgi:hypothetical protein
MINNQQSKKLAPQQFFLLLQKSCLLVLSRFYVGLIGQTPIHVCRTPKDQCWAHLLRPTLSSQLRWPVRWAVSHGSLPRPYLRILRNMACALPSFYRHRECCACSDQHQVLISSDQSRVKTNLWPLGRLDCPQLSLFETNLCICICYSIYIFPTIVTIVHLLVLITCTHYCVSIILL